MFLTTDSKPRQGGAAQYLHGLCGALAKKGFSVTVFSLAEGCERFPAQGYALKPLEKRPERELGRRPGDGFFLTRKLNTAVFYRRLKQMALSDVRALPPTDEVVINYWPVVAHFWCEACKALGLPYRLICHGMDLATPVTGPLRRWRQDDLRGARAVILNSSPTMELAQRVAGKALRCTVVHPGIDALSCLTPAPAKLSEMRARLRLPENARVLLSIGRLVKRKGFDLALGALAALKQELPSLHYVIAGEGPESGALKGEAARLGLSERVRFLESVTDEEKWALFALCDIFVMPNRTLGDADWEGFGIVFLEAALAGKPSIGGNNGGVPDAIADGVTGCLVDTGDRSAVAAAVGKLFRDEPARLRMGHAARERALREFSWERAAEKFEAGCSA